MLLFGEWDKIEIIYSFLQGADKTEDRTGETKRGTGESKKEREQIREKGETQIGYL